MRILIVLSFCLCLQTSHVTSDIAEPAVLGSVGSNNDFSNNKDFSHTDTSNKDVFRNDIPNKDVYKNDIPNKDIYKNDKPGPIRVSKCCEFDSLLIESNLGVRECRRRADVLHLNVDVSRRKWEPAFFDPESGDEIIGPEKYVLDIGVPNCESHESKFAVFHHQVIVLLFNFFVAVVVVIVVVADVVIIVVVVTGPEKYVLDIGDPPCESHESKFAVFHHQVFFYCLQCYCCCSCCFCCCCFCFDHWAGKVCSGHRGSDLRIARVEVCRFSSSGNFCVCC
jgi:hypothetical protein